MNWSILFIGKSCSVSPNIT